MSSPGYREHKRVRTPLPGDSPPDSSCGLFAVCAHPADMRSLGDRAITGFLLKLTALLPLVETSVDAAKTSE